MSNIIKIKHGSNPPIADNLEQHELGYAESNKGLYVKDSKNEVIHLNDTSKIEEDINTLNQKIEGFSGIVVSDTEPENTGALWIDISVLEGEPAGNGIGKYYDETTSSWVPLAAIWG